MPSDSEQQLKLAQERTDLASERNKLANERTFLAWVRTGLAGVGGGIAILRLLTFKQPSHQITAQFVGEALILWGIFVFFVAWLEYYKFFKMQKENHGKGTSFAYVSILAFTLIILSAIMFVITLRDHA